MWSCYSKFLKLCGKRTHYPPNHPPLPPKPSPITPQTIPEHTLDHAQTTPKPPPNTPHTAGTWRACTSEIGIGGPVPKNTAGIYQRRDHTVWGSCRSVQASLYQWNRYRLACTSEIGTGGPVPKSAGIYQRRAHIVTYIRTFSR